MPAYLFFDENAFVNNVLSKVLHLTIDTIVLLLIIAVRGAPFRFQNVENFGEFYKILPKTILLSSVKDILTRLGQIIHQTMCIDEPILAPFSSPHGYLVLSYGQEYEMTLNDLEWPCKRLLATCSQSYRE